MKYRFYNVYLWGGDDTHTNKIFRYYYGSKSGVEMKSWYCASRIWRIVQKIIWHIRHTELSSKKMARHSKTVKLEKKDLFGKRECA